MINVGIAFGGYCPLHQGHLDVIMRAKKENNMAFVVVCGYDNEPRGSSTHLPLLKRFRIIHNYLEDETLKVITVNDTALGIDESMSKYNWQIWTSCVRKQICHILSKNIDDINCTWYVAEDRYKDDLSSLGTKDNIILMDRNENPISGTLCRNFPLKYWNKITPPFRAYFSHNILISGTASEGKTTLTRDIGKYFSILYSYEKGRDNCSLKTDPEFNVKDFIYNIYEQHKYNEELICSPQNTGVFVSDTDNMVTLMYAKAYCDRKDFAIDAKDYKLLESLSNAYLDTTKWDKIFLLAPSKKPIVDDGERYMPDSDYCIRVKFFENLKKLYDNAGYKYEILNGNYYENFCQVKKYINSLYGEGN